MTNIVALTPRSLTDPAFQHLAEVPAEAQWFANISNPQTRRAYENDIRSFMASCGIQHPKDFRLVTRSHVLAWRADLENQQLAGATIRRKLAALASLYEYLCNANAVTHNPVKGVKRPKVESQEGKTPALSDAQARALLESPPADTLKGIRDRAILSVLLFHGLRREELCKLRVKDFGQQRRGVAHMLVFGKGGKQRYIPIHSETAQLVAYYLKLAGHAGQTDGALFRSLRSSVSGTTVGLSPGGVYAEVVKRYLNQLGIVGENMGPHALRATATTSALENDADIAQVQEWLGHSNISTTKVYDRRDAKPRQSPTFKVKY
ncbi:MAG: tyrosine-type recombinase/integrase [Rhodoferax sp.]|jgi:integrase/recombinase XerD|uniref:tyrosine-type recombinase/integrase n=1 Tax=Rhodoferax sp. TaxID=50421 RepID=UPI001B5619CE|nr:tyrosine-type recombinase/integrase [Rhodoferax sp.]MBP9149084.1 tyrosine-type recombinase/integrase [Rhodoferax sp.]MBP9737728.1 tyrosine-type recombinase/integrase [Rhodoferax sp.]